MAGKRLGTIQGYRFLLFMLVFLFHSMESFFPMGWGGVQGFLVLSSYFVTTKYCQYDDIKIGKELWHRIRRLYPAYILLILGATILFVVAFRQIPYDIPYYLLSAQNFFWIAFGWSTPLSGLLGHTWYITLDVYLFILWIFVIKYIPRKRLRSICYIGIAISITWRVICNLLSDDRTLSYTMPIGQLDSYCIGALVALNAKSNKKYAVFDISTGIIGILTCILYVVWFNGLGLIESYQFFGNSSNYTHEPLLVNIYMFVGILSAGVMRLCLQAGENTIMSNKWMVALGNMSYELYLFHYPFIFIVNRFLSNSWIVAIISLSLTIISAYMWHNFAEKRVKKLIRI